jgi:two-component sensor histidine kinase
VSIAPSLRALWKPESPAEALAACLLVYNPVVCIGFRLMFGFGEDAVRRWLVSLAIADVVAIQCLLGVTAIVRLEGAVRKARGRPPAERGILWSFLLSTLLMPFALPAGFYAGGLASEALGLSFTPPDFAAYRVGLGFGVLVSGGFFLQRTRADAKDAIVRAEARIRDLDNRRLEAQLAALTAEMNPHLLFNALNTIAALIPRDPEGAEETVIELAGLYRGILRACGSATHSLSDELRLCEAYLRVEKARFGQRLAARHAIDDALDTSLHVPVLLLQPFVENAVKHGLSQRARGGAVSIGARRSKGGIALVVEDDGVGLGASRERGAGRALANCHERLRLAYGGRAGIELAERPGGGTRVTIQLPAVAP